jgi:hypothetical protein
MAHKRFGAQDVHSRYLQKLNGFKQTKTELGWAGFRLTDYGSLEQGWKLLFSRMSLKSEKIIAEII